MSDFIISEDLGITWVTLKGRIDSMSSPEIQKRMNDLILSGKRTLVVNLEEVTYVSSAGLRIFLDAQKKLKKADGEIILYKIPESIMNLFKMSGFLQVFPVASSREDVASALEGKKAASPMMSREIEGITIHFIAKPAGAGSLVMVGSQENLAPAQYSERDVVSVKPEEFQFGTGLATLGEHYQDYKQYFGEALIINRNFFFYPAIKQPAVDFLLSTQQEQNLAYRFLHGFGFKGAYRYLVSFERADGQTDLTSLVNVLLTVSEANMIGIVLLAESKGLFGMNLRKVPIIENKPQNGKEIFDTENFPEWMNFPVEPGDINNIVVGTGMAIKDKGRERPELQGAVGKGNNFHIHGGVFGKEPFNRNMDQFEDELTRIMTELEVSKVQHLLGQTRFSNGIAGIIELKE